MFQSSGIRRTDWSRSPRIVLADSDPDSRAVLKAMLGDLGAQIVEVSDGAELQALLGKQSADLVVTRSQLPRRSGLQVLAQQRARGASVPFVVVHSLHRPLLRVFVSDTTSHSVLATRTVDADNLIDLVIRLVRPTCGAAEESSRRRREPTE